MVNGLDSLQDRGWTVYPWMVVKECGHPYCKCIGAIRRGKISRVYWMPFPPPLKVKQQFLSELGDYMDGRGPNGTAIEDTEMRPQPNGKRKK